MRLTRAARRAEAAQDISTSPHAPDAHTSDPNRRVPLGNVSINPIREPIEPDDLDPKAMAPNKPKATSTKVTKPKKPKTRERYNVDEVQLVLGDERQAAGSPASDAAVDDLAASPANGTTQSPLADRMPASPSSRAVRRTRRQLAAQDEAIPPSQSGPTLAERVFTENVDNSKPSGFKLEDHTEGTTAGHQGPNSNIRLPAAVPSAQEVAASEQQPSPRAEEEIGDESPALLKASDAHGKLDCKLHDAQSGAPRGDTLPVSRTLSRSPSRSPAKSPLPLEESIEAIDALQEALEKVVPEFNPSVDEQSPRKPRPSKVQRSQHNNTKKVPPRASVVTRAARPSMTRSSSVRTASAKERKGSAEVVDYLASRRQPISINFPAPRPPPKATKPPTVPTFQLPGEAVAAKLKAQKEERLKREQKNDHQRQPRETLTRPFVKSSKPPTKPNFQLPGEAVAAKLKALKEERLKREAQGLTARPSNATLQPPSLAKSSKPPTVPNFQLPGDAVAAKLKAQREERRKREEEEAAKRPALKARGEPTQRNGPVVVRRTAASKARESVLNEVGKRDAGKGDAGKGEAPSTENLVEQTSSVQQQVMKRSSVVAARQTPIAPVDGAALRQKGREIFNRDKVEKEQRERERRVKEEAAKKARAEAAERGRIASREWAEKQRKKMMAAAAAVATTTTTK
ncbi:uncharacterized protein EI97DRAFT_428644 [Westerdykella ornata]|uniref:Uncharacterized protein n=1 Tax=Westerdykella ornata TaxID=318751 RepID=A0A6A6JWF2_WESOR|nr:uncharacterized protein EI97DRAFT_428644 [Westerdykella ornata]KAF2280555.1 hypothetical protein EI97DRAFT_428644 [Westerdykella ornata]